MVDIHRVLGDVSQPFQAFWFTNGTIAHNVYELVNAMESCSQSVFDYHANPEKNDFYNWILDVLGDDVLAKKIKSEFDQSRCAKKIRKRIKELEKL